MTRTCGRAAGKASRNASAPADSWTTCAVAGSATMRQNRQVSIATPSSTRSARSLPQPHDVLALSLPVGHAVDLPRHLRPRRAGAGLHLAGEQALDPLEVPLEHDQLPSAHDRALLTMPPEEPAGRDDEQVEALLPPEAERADLEDERHGELVRDVRGEALQVLDLVAAQALQAGAHEPPRSLAEQLHPAPPSGQERSHVCGSLGVHDWAARRPARGSRR